MQKKVKRGDRERRDRIRERSGEEREAILIQADNQPPLYITPFIDDFNKDVVESKLSKRGWVMQERLLAHRTIYFTETQTYWECGEGIRCETLTKADK